MSKAGRLKHKRAKARRKPRLRRNQSPPSTKRRILRGLTRAWDGVSLVWKIAGIAFVILGGVSTLYFFTVRLSVTPRETLNETDPFTTVFVLQNDGQLPVYDVTFVCLENRVTFTDGNSIENTAVSTPFFNVPVLGANAKTSAQCHPANRFGVHPVLNADIGLSISYRPSFFPFHRVQVFHYTALPTSNHTWAWVETAK